MGEEKAQGKDSFVLHMDDFEDISDLKDADAGKLLKAILAYAADASGDLPKLGVQAKTMFGYIRRHMDRDRAKYEATCAKRAKAGKLGGRPKKGSDKAKKANGFFEKQNNPDNDPDPDSEYEYDPEYEPEYEPEPVAAPDGGPGGSDSGLWASEKEKQNRIRYLETMCELYQSGAFQDDGTRRRLSMELESLRGGAQ